MPKMKSKYFFRSPFRQPDNLDKHTQNLHELERAFNEHTHDQGVWLSWTPSIATSGGTSWALGNGTASGQYVRIDRLVHFRAFVQFGSTSTFGTGALLFTLPVDLSVGSEQATARFVDSNPGVGYLGGWYPLNATQIVLACYGSSGSFITDSAVTSTLPYTWANGDSIELGGWYSSTS